MELYIAVATYRKLRYGGAGLGLVHMPPANQVCAFGTDITDFEQHVGGNLALHVFQMISEEYSEKGIPLPADSTKILHA
jgi:hypothetical protein